MEVLNLVIDQTFFWDFYTSPKILLFLSSRMFHKIAVKVLLHKGLSLVSKHTSSTIEQNDLLPITSQGNIKNLPKKKGK